MAGILDLIPNRNTPQDEQSDLLHAGDLAVLLFCYAEGIFDVSKVKQEIELRISRAMTPQELSQAAMLRDFIAGGADLDTKRSRANWLASCFEFYEQGFADVTASQLLSIITGA